MGSVTTQDLSWLQRFCSLTRDDWTRSPHRVVLKRQPLMIATDVCYLVAVKGEDKSLPWMPSVAIPNVERLLSFAPDGPVVDRAALVTWAEPAEWAVPPDPDDEDDHGEVPDVRRGWLGPVAIDRNRLAQLLAHLPEGDLRISHTHHGLGACVYLDVPGARALLMSMQIKDDKTTEWEQAPRFILAGAGDA